MSKPSTTQSNERAISTGLRGAGVAFHKPGETHPVVVGLSRNPQARRTDALTVINLPPNSWTSIRVYGDLRSQQSEVLETIDNPDWIELVAYFPDGEKFSYEIDPEQQKYLYYSPPLANYQRGS